MSHTRDNHTPVSLKGILTVHIGHASTHSTQGRGTLQPGKGEKVAGAMDFMVKVLW
jgi:hypothetical protein